jgi:hypothetical protein
MMPSQNAKIYKIFCQGKVGEPSWIRNEGYENCEVNLNG